VVVHEAPGDDMRESDAAHDIHIVSKGDLLAADAESSVLVTSAKTGQGIEELKRAIVDRAVGGAAESDDGVVVTSERQRTLLEQGSAALGRAARAVEEKAPTEMVALELREATEALAQVMGERVGDEVLDALFSRFCIGK
jgi:tRNA modification GTPase